MQYYIRNIIPFLFLAGSLPLLANAQKATNIVILSSCTVRDKPFFIATFAQIADLIQAERPGVEAWSIMDSSQLGHDDGKNDTVAIVEAYASADEFGPHLQVQGVADLYTDMASLIEECNTQAWGGWSDEIEDHFANNIPGSRMFHEDPHGYIDFCRDGADAKKNYPVMIFMQRRATDPVINRATLNEMGDYFRDNLPGIIGWMTAINPDQPDVVHDLQLFRDYYSFLDHTNPFVVPFMDWFPKLLASWIQPFEYNGTFVGYHLTNVAPRVQIPRGGFSDVEFFDFFPRGTPEGQSMGFMKFCATPGGTCGSSVGNDTKNRFADSSAPHSAGLTVTTFMAAVSILGFASMR